MKIDTHQHFWSYNDRDYVWMSAAMEKLRRDHLPTDLLTAYDESPVLTGTVAVQARQCLEESTWLLELADDTLLFARWWVGWISVAEGLSISLSSLRNTQNSAASGMSSMMNRMTSLCYGQLP